MTLNEVREKRALLKEDPVLENMAVGGCVVAFCNARDCGELHDCELCLMAEFMNFMQKRTDEAVDKKKQDG